MKAAVAGDAALKAALLDDLSGTLAGRVAVPVPAFLGRDGDECRPTLGGRDCGPGDPRGAAGGGLAEAELEPASGGDDRGQARAILPPPGRDQNASFGFADGSDVRHSDGVQRP